MFSVLLVKSRKWEVQIYLPHLLVRGGQKSNAALALMFEL